MKNLVIALVTSSLLASSVSAEYVHIKRSRFFELGRPMTFRNGVTEVMVANGVRCILAATSFPVDYQETRLYAGAGNVLDAASKVQDPVSQIGLGTVGMITGLFGAGAEGIKKRSNTRKKENLELASGFRFVLQNWVYSDQWRPYPGTSGADNPYGMRGSAEASGRRYTIRLYCNPPSHNSKELAYGWDYRFPTYKDGTTDMGDFLDSGMYFVEKFPETALVTSGPHNDRRIKVLSPIPESQAKAKSKRSKR